MTAHFDHYAPEPPCDSCGIARTCRVQKLLCHAYEAYTQGHSWQYMVRQPTRELFDKMFHVPTAEEHEKFEQDLAKRRARAAAREDFERRYLAQSLAAG